MATQCGFGEVVCYPHIVILRVKSKQIKKNYRKFLKRLGLSKSQLKKTNIDHITIVDSSEIRLNKKAGNLKLDVLSKYNKEKFLFKYCSIPKREDNVLKINICCDVIEDIREEAGLPRQGKHLPHITLARLF